jgi:hypothetical protein
MESDPVHRAFSIRELETDKCSARVAVSHNSMVGSGVLLVMFDIVVTYYLRTVGLRVQDALVRTVA